MIGKRCFEYQSTASDISESIFEDTSTESSLTACNFALITDNSIQSDTNTSNELIDELSSDFSDQSLDLEKLGIEFSRSSSSDNVQFDSTDSSYDERNTDVIIDSVLQSLYSFRFDNFLTKPLTKDFGDDVCKHRKLKRFKKNNIMKKFAFNFRSTICRSDKSFCTKNHDESENKVQCAMEKYESKRNKLCPPIESEDSSSSIYERIYDADTSPKRGWQRVGDNYHANTYMCMSPIKHNLGILQPNISDTCMATFTWILNMSESFYYDNIILLLSRSRGKCIFGGQFHKKLVSDALRSNWTNITQNAMNYWKNVLKLGRGSYGSVYRVMDSRTKEFYAVKYVNPKMLSVLDEQTLHLINFFKERNSLIRAHNNPFIMQFFSSFIIPEVDGLFLVFEYCVSNLGHFINKLNNYRTTDRSSIYARIKYKISKLTNNLSFKSMYKTINKKIGHDLHEIIIVYAFELFCGLDFLARCEIVHRDIKPDNILLNENMHLKIGDFGLVINNYYLTSVFNRKFIHSLLTSSVDKRRYVQAVVGTYNYIDPDSYLYKECQDFMSDAYSVALVIQKMMMLGGNFFKSLKKLPEIREWAKDQGMHRFIRNVTNDDDLYQEYIVDNMVDLFDDERMKQLARFIAPLLRPRNKRITDYLKKKRSRRYHAEFFSAHIDMGQVQTMVPFSSIGLTPHNVFGYNYQLKPFLGISHEKTTRRTFKDLINNKISYQDKPKYHRKRLLIEPGISMTLPP